MTDMNVTGRGGQRTFVAGSVVLLLFGATHLVAVYKSATTPPATPQEQAMDKALREVVLFSAGPLKTTAHDAMGILSRSYSVLLIFAGMIDLLCWRAMAAAGRLGRLALANLIFTAILAIIPMLAQFPPPAVFGIVASILFFLAWRGQRVAPSANGLVEQGATA